MDFYKIVDGQVLKGKQSIKPPYICTYLSLFTNQIHDNSCNTMAGSSLPSISHYITSYNPEGTSVYLDVANPPPPYSKDENHRIDYIYSLSASPTGPTLKDDVDYKEHQTVAAQPPHILFPTAGASAAVVVTVRLVFYITPARRTLSLHFLRQ